MRIFFYVLIIASVLLTCFLISKKVATFYNNSEKDFFIDFKGNTNLDPSFMEAFNAFTLFKGKSRQEIFDIWKLRGFDSKENFHLLDTSKTNTWVLYIPKEGDVGYGYVFNEDSFYSISLRKLDYINFSFPAGSVADDPAQVKGNR